MKIAYLLLAGLAMVACIPILSGDGPKDNKVQQLMKKKLQHSQKVLEGIALNDFDLVSKNAEDLMQVSKEAEWRVLKSPEYEVNSNEFRRSTTALIKAAKDKNIDGAALAYVDLTLSCVRCHKHLREVRQTRLDQPGAERRAAQD
jgi:cytochrome c556